MERFNQTNFLTFFCIIVGLYGLTLQIQAQTTSVLTVGLEKPSKLIIAPNNSLLVAEAGTFMPTSMARDGETGDIFVTEIFTGRIILVTH